MQIIVVHRKAKDFHQAEKNCLFPCGYSPILHTMVYLFPFFFWERSPRFQLPSFLIADHVLFEFSFKVVIASCFPVN